MTTLLVLGAGGSAAANLIDALRRSNHDYRIIGADASPVRLHLSTADERIVIPRADAPSYIDDLQAVIQRFSCDVVLPQPDPDTHAVGAARDRLGARTYLPAQAALDLAADKLAFAQRMREADVPVPDAMTFSSMTDVVPVCQEMLTRYPQLWVRARAGAGARGSLPVRSGEQARAWIAWWHEERGIAPSDFMASELLPGREFAYQSVWQHGQLVAGQARERVEYLYGHLTPSGQTSTPAVARTVRQPVVDDTAMKAIRALDPSPEGVYCVDIKESADGVAKVTEINAGRFFTTSNFFAAAGINMPDMLVRCALGEDVEPIGTAPLRAGLYWIRMVDMGYVLVPEEELDPWPHAGG
ncbi:MAG TPA: hypothetical protein VNC41_20250 [Acidimicrobiia bacterium]|nr:hypothetical protein [Acidimicrobiia bacterium]